jgi:DNA-binding NarL/FixJ family response regulator
MNPIRILLADDHPAFMAGVQAELEKEEDMVVVGRAHSGLEALRLVRELAPDILLLDMQLPDLSGVEVAQRLREHHSPVLVLPLSGFSDPEYVTGVLEHGAAGYMTKDESIGDIVKAVRKVARGGVHISARVAFNIVSERQRRARTEARFERAMAELRQLGVTPTLLEVLRLIAEGLNNKQIADRLSRSEHTIRNHVDKLRDLLGVQWRPEVVAWAWRQGIMEIDVAEYTTYFALRAGE